MGQILHGSATTQPPPPPGMNEVPGGGSCLAQSPRIS